MSLRDKVKEAVDQFFSNGEALEKRIVAMASEEIDEALEELRPGIRKKIDEALDLTMRTIKVESIIVDAEKVRGLLSDQIETIIEEDEDETIAELLSEKLYKELKETTLLPLLKKEQSN